jgi:hypothetical protein
LIRSEKEGSDLQDLIGVVRGASVCVATRGEGLRH